MSGIIVIGVGNILFRDEGVGVFAARFLEANYDFSPNIEIIDGATLGFALMRYFQEYDEVLIIDTVSIKDEIGSVYRLPAAEMMGLGSYRQTAHEVEIVEMLEICSLLDKMANVTIFGIVPQDITSVGIGLTTKLEVAFSNLIAPILKELNSLGVSYQRKNDVSLSQIISNITNQTSESQWN